MIKMINTPQAEPVVVPEENVRVHRRRAGGQAGGRLLQVRERLQQVIVYGKLGGCQGANAPEVSVVIYYSLTV